MNERKPAELSADFGSDGGDSGPGLLHSIVRRKWLVVLFATIGGGLGYLNYQREPPVYQSDARILVIKEQAPEGFQKILSSGAYDDGLATQMLLIRSPLIIQDAVENRQLGKLRMFADTLNPVPRIMASMEVKPAALDKASVMDLIMKGGVSEDCQTVLEAVIES